MATIPTQRVAYYWYENQAGMTAVERFRNVIDCGGKGGLILGVTGGIIGFFIGMPAQGFVVGALIGGTIGGAYGEELTPPSEDGVLIPPPLDLLEDMPDEILDGLREQLLKDLSDSNDPPFAEPWEMAKTTAPVQIDPLLIDLNGDGIKTTDLANGTYFDHNKDGYAELSAWVDENDGILAYDINGDGVINDGGEIFGDQFVLSNGQNATSGFNALKSLDYNNDNIINANDNEFDNIKILKGDGTLITLEEAGIVSINLNSSNSNTTDENGNVQLSVSSYTTEDGSTYQIGDYLFNRDTLYSVSTNQVEISDDIAALPDAKGYGIVDSLHQAMAKDTTGELQALVEAFVDAASTADKREILADIIYKWTGADSVASNSRGNDINAKDLHALEKFMGEDFVGVSNTTNPNAQAANILNAAFANLREYIYAQLAVATSLKPIYDLITFKFNDDANALVIDLAQTAEYIQGVILENEDEGIALLSEFDRTFKTLGLKNDSDYQSFYDTFVDMNSSYKLILDSSDKTLLYGTSGDDDIDGTANTEAVMGGSGDDTIYSRQGDDIVYGEDGDDYIDLCEGNDVGFGGSGDDTVKGGYGNDTLIGSTGDDYLEGYYGDDTYIFNLGDGNDTINENTSSSAGNDTIQFGEGIDPDDLNFYVLGNDLFIKYSDNDSIKVVDFSNDNHAIENFVFADGTTLTRAQVLAKLEARGTSGNDSISGSSYSETLYGYAGNDTIQAGNGNDILYGGSGDDSLDGGDDNDILYGETGDDSLYGGEGNDTLIGNAGDDYLEGNYGDDTYIFNLGDGNDIIYENTYYNGGNDTIQFGEGINPDDVNFYILDYDLFIKYSDNDSIRINYFTIDSVTIENFVFADGTTLTREQVLAKLEVKGTSGEDSLQGSSYSETLYGYAGNDTIQAGNGNDILYGGSGDDSLDGGDDNDILYGEAGDDTLEGYYGDDVLIGSTGNDYLDGNYGDDTYIFNLGDGNDTISEYTGTDTIQFGEGISLEDLNFYAVGNNIHIKYSDNDSILISNFTSSSTYIVENFVFADGTILTKDEMLAMLTTHGTENADSITGSGYSETIYAYGGNDSVQAGSGDDIIYGGNGNDATAMTHISSILVTAMTQSANIPATI